MNMRKIGFNIVDSLKGGAIKKHVNDISYKMANYTEVLNTNDLNDILNHATTTTSYYKKYHDKPFNDYPILNKESLKRNYNEILSTNYSKNELVTTTTSGSYGTPFTYHLTASKKKRQTAEVLYFGQLANYDIGIKHAYARVTKAKSKFKLFLQNELLIDPTNMSEGWFEDTRNELKKGYKIIIGYPSTISMIARYSLEKGDTHKDYSINGIICMAEPLVEEDKKVMEKLFNCSVTNRYSTEEFGVIANSCSHGNLHINHATFYVELLDENNLPVSENEVGRIIVTDKYSHALPLIRYDIGDNGKFMNGCSCGFKGKVLTEVLGRQVETIYNVDNVKVSPFAINGAMRDMDGVLRYQFSQETVNTYELKLVCMNGFDDTQIEVIRKRFLEILGSKAKINIYKVSAIHSLKSGKRPYIIQNFKK